MVSPDLCLACLDQHKAVADRLHDLCASKGLGSPLPEDLLKPMHLNTSTFLTHGVMVLPFSLSHAQHHIFMQDDLEMLRRKFRIQTAPSAWKRA